MISSSAPSTGPTPDEIRHEVEKILGSKSFSGSETLRNLLRYLTDRRFESPSHPPKEHDVATNLLGRGGDYDPKLDPVVRVQTTRLRAKLAEYYVSEGAEERVYIEIPKGSYTVTATYRGVAHATEVASEPESPAIAPPAAEPSRTFTRREHPTAWIAVALAIVVAMLAGAWWWSRQADPDLRSFWALFTSSKAETIVVFSNPRFVGSSVSGMRIFDPSRDGSERINGGYTGAGEVMAVHALSTLFARMNSSLRPRRAQLFTWDDTRGHNVIFVGAPPHNVPLFDVSMATRFRMKPYGQQPRPDAGCFENLQPRAGEEALYCMSTEGSTQTEYAMVTFSTGLDRRQRTILVAGTTTFGTEAAVEFLCDQERMAGLHRSLGGQRWPAFEALLRCTIRSGVPVSAELVLSKITENPQ